MTHTKAVTKNSNTNAVDAGTDPQPPVVTPEAVVEQLRAVRSTLETIPMTAAERKRLGRAAKTPSDVLQAQINMIGASDEISSVIDTPVETIRTMADDSSRWTAVEDELRVILSVVEARNIVKRQELQRLTSRATNIGAELARDPKHAPVLGAHLQEIRKLKRLARRKRAAQTPTNPAPSAGNGIPTE